MLFATILTALPLLAPLVNAEPLGVASPRSERFGKREAVLSNEMIDKVTTLAYSLNNKR